MAKTIPTSARQWLLAGGSLMMLAAGAPCYAQQANAVESAGAESRTFNVPAQSLQSALNQFAKQSDRELLFSTGIVAGKRSGGVRGKHSATVALDMILKGTGLTYRRAPSGAFLIQDTAGATSASTTEGQVSPEVASVEDASQTTDIVVTATLRNERAKDVPSSITALGSQQLRDLQATRFDDFISQIPNISFSGTRGGNRQIILRGISTSTFEQSATVATYVDDVAIGSSTALAVGARFKPDVNVFDLDRIEVLRGPQGTLYGANSLGGLLKYVTIAPSTTGLNVLARAEVNTVAHGGQGFGFDGAVNIPLDGEFALRISGFRHHEAGWIDDIGLGKKDVNDLTSSGGRASLLGRIGDRLTVRATAMYQRLRTGASSQVDVLASGAPQFGPYLQQRFTPEPNTQEFQLYSGSIEYDLSGATLSSITSYNVIKQLNRLDYSQYDAGTFAGFNFYPDQTTTLTKRLTQEFRLASRQNHSVEWLAGAFYTRENSSFTDKEVGTTSSYASVDTPGAPLSFFNNAVSRYEQLAAYGDVTVYLGEMFDITGGVRYTHNDTRLVSRGDGFYNGGPSLQNATSKDDAWTFLVTPRLHLSDSTMIYARAAKGFRPGGPNLLTPAAVAAGALPAFDSDSLWNYEAGIKTATSDRSLSLDLTVFYIDWSKIQIRQTVGGFAFTGNAGKASSKGAELAVTARPTRGFTASFNVGYTDAALTQNALSLGGLAGAQLPNAPRWTLGGALDYQFALTGSVGANLGASWRVVSDRLSDFNRNLSPRFMLDGYGTLDLHAGVRLKQFDIDVFAKNVTNTRGIESFSPNFFPVSVAISRPRTVGLAVTARY